MSCLKNFWLLTQNKEHNMTTASETSPVSLVSITPEAEKIMGYVARVSSPQNQGNDAVKLLRYCLRKGHWSVFEHAFMTLDIATTRMISAQIIRHRSFTFSEFSQRYAAVAPNIEIGELRRQDEKNRQNSTDDLDPELAESFTDQANILMDSVTGLYSEMLDAGVAKESARQILPMCAPTRIFMSGSIRNWIHYIDVRTEDGVQKEHKDIAEAVKAVFVDNLPVVASAKGWT